MFDTLWNKAIPSENRIKEIEEGIKLETIEVIRNHNEALNRELGLLKSAKHEILIIFSTMNTFYIQEKQLRITQLLKDAVRRGVNIRILTPIDRNITQMIAELKEESKENNNSKNNTRDHIPGNTIQIQDITQSSGIKSKTIVTDKQESLTMEIRDTNQTQSFSQAIALSTYSNSKSTVLSYLSIFEALWNESELKTKLEDAYHRLEANNQAQREFISVAAHELRTPIMPILGFAEMLLEEEKEEEKKEALSIIVRNSQRLIKLASNILDTAKIETNTLKLERKEAVNLNELISEIVNEYRKTDNEKQQREQDTIKVFSKKNTDRHNSNAKTNIVFKTIQRDQGDQDILVNVDKERLTQVMSNLLDNALKFGEDGGDILVTVEKKDNNEKSNDRRELEEEDRSIFTQGNVGKQQQELQIQEEDKEEIIVISVKDRGSGIDQEVLPRIFSKFTTKSDKGTGLGLYISKYMVEAHGGRMWAENNADGKGATITFTLPLK